MGVVTISKNHKYGNVALIIICTFSFMLNIPTHVSARQPYEDITAYSNFTNDFTLQANLTYDTEQWWFDRNKTLWFTISVTVPSTGNMTLNITRIDLFIDFDDDDFVYFLYRNDTVGMFECMESQILLNMTYSVVVSSNQLGFIKDAWNIGHLGFRIQYNVSLAVDSWTNELSEYNIYSRNPDGYSWQSYNLIIGDNEDSVDLDDYWEYSPLMTIGPVLIGIVIFFVGLVIAIKVYSYWSDHNPKSYIHKKRQIGGKTYNLGGLRIALAYCIKVDVPDSSEAVLSKSMISEWARNELGIEINLELDGSQLTDTRQILWEQAEHQLSLNAGGVFTYLLNVAPIGERGIEYIKLLENHGFSLDGDTREYLIENTDKTAENLRKRWSEERNPNKMILEYIRDLITKVTDIDEKIPEISENFDAKEFAGILIARKQIEGNFDSIMESAAQRLGLTEIDLRALQSDETSTIDSLLPRIHELLIKRDLDEDLDVFYSPDPVVLKEENEKIVDASTNKEKGDALEGFFEYIFSSLRGFRIQRNERAKTGEIDLFIYNNHTRIPFFTSLGERILVECKNWDKKVGVPVIDQIIADMKKYDSHFAIIATREGITGTEFKDAKRLILKMHDKENLDIVVFENKDIDNLVNGLNLIDLLREKKEELRLS